jgi:hypothetical protein
MVCFLTPLTWLFWLKRIKIQKVKQLQLRFGLYGRFYSMRRYDGMVIIWWSVEIQLSWWTIHQTCGLAHVGIKKGTNNKWTYDQTSHLMVSLETTIACSSYSNLDIRECHHGCKNLHWLYWWILGFLIIHMIGVDYKVYLYAYINECT